MDQEFVIQKTSLPEITIGPEDYSEPSCLLCGTPYGMTPEVKPVPIQRIIEKMDEYQAKKDAGGAQRHLLYWLEEAKLGQDLRGQLSIRNELIGFYRKNGKKEDAFKNIEEALKLLEELQLEGTVTSGTTFINAATAYYTFGDYEKALPLFEKAKTVYEANSETDKKLLGGLYNNMGLVNAALGRYGEASSQYQKALLVMNELPDGKLEQAITYLNMADAKEAEKGSEEAEEEIAGLLAKAEELLDEVWDYLEGKSQAETGYYAFVCESCASVFSYYGYFMTAEELNRRARKIYERNAALQGVF